MSEAAIDGSGNVFADLGFTQPEAMILEMRAKLLSDLREYLAASKMADAEAAIKLEICEGRLRDLRAGSWDKFSLETLITLEARAGRTVTVELAA